MNSGAVGGGTPGSLSPSPRTPELELALPLSTGEEDGWMKGPGHGRGST